MKSKDLKQKISCNQQSKGFLTIRDIDSAWERYYETIVGNYIKPLILDRNLLNIYRYQYFTVKFACLIS